MNTVDKMITKALQEQSEFKELKIEYSLDNDLAEVISDKPMRFLNDYEGEDIYSEIMTNATYMDLAIFVNEQIHKSQDDHHVFLEDLYPHSIQNEGTPEAVQVYAYALGS